MSRARVYGTAEGQSLTRFLEPSTLARIANLDLLSRTVVEGFISGLHHSPFFGRSLDFAEHRQYMPGDDIRLIDWKLFARTDRFYVKEFEADTNTNCTILLDVSRSMSFGGGNTTAKTPIILAPRTALARSRSSTTAATCRPASLTSRTSSVTGSASSPSIAR